jgi:hypothetical protein
MTQAGDSRTFREDAPGGLVVFHRLGRNPPMIARLRVAPAAWALRGLAGDTWARLRQREGHAGQESGDREAFGASCPAHRRAAAEARREVEAHILQPAAYFSNAGLPAPAWIAPPSLLVHVC